MLSKTQASKIVQKAIVRAGGFNEIHPPDQTLSKAGLKTGHQRESFQRKMARGVGEHKHKFERVGQVPNKATTEVSTVREYVVNKAVPVGS
jgi:hypothetical protein